FEFLHQAWNTAGPFDCGASRYFPNEAGRFTSDAKELMGLSNSLGGGAAAGAFSSKRRRFAI
ncbi:MAG: hypothetical protein NZO58_14730, partial [Gemmataceae bacterium]|nr:hypothetical protein [Gemmataceae bacterium]